MPDIKQAKPYHQVQWHNIDIKAIQGWLKTHRVQFSNADSKPTLVRKVLREEYCRRNTGGRAHSLNDINDPHYHRRLARNHANKILVKEHLRILKAANYNFYKENKMPRDQEEIDAIKKVETACNAYATQLEKRQVEESGPVPKAPALLQYYDSIPMDNGKTGESKVEKPPQKNAKLGVYGTPLDLSLLPRYYAFKPNPPKQPNRVSKKVPKGKKVPEDKMVPKGKKGSKSSKTPEPPKVLVYAEFKTTASRSLDLLDDPEFEKSYHTENPGPNLHPSLFFAERPAYKHHIFISKQYHRVRGERVVGFIELVKAYRPTQGYVNNTGYYIDFDDGAMVEGATFHFRTSMADNKNLFDHPEPKISGLRDGIPFGPMGRQLVWVAEWETKMLKAANGEETDAKEGCDQETPPLSPKESPIADDVKSGTSNDGEIS